jgi:hypothetical protein
MYTATYFYPSVLSVKSNKKDRKRYPRDEVFLDRKKEKKRKKKQESIRYNGDD